MPFISIIVPTRNRPEDLRKCLDGIAAQTFTDYEVLVVDDGSSASVRETYAQMAVDFGPRLRFLLPSHPYPWGSGPGAARNRGLAVAEGEYTGFCDDDDRWTAGDPLRVAANALKLTAADAYFAAQESLLAGELAKASWQPELRAWSAGQKPVSDDDVYRLPLDPLLACDHFPHLNISLYLKARSAFTGRRESRGSADSGKRFQISEMHHYGSVADQVEKERGPRASLPFVLHKLAANFRWRSVLHLGAATLKAWAERAGLQAAGR